MIYLQHTAQDNMSAMRTLRGSVSTPKGWEIRSLKEAEENQMEFHYTSRNETVRDKPYSIPDRKLENAMTAKVNRRFHLKVNDKFSAMLWPHLRIIKAALGSQNNRNSLI